MNIQPVFTRYDINRKIPFDRSSPIVVDHVEDFDTRFIEVYVYESVYNKQVDLKGTTITARIVAALSTEKILLNDNVVCTLNNSGNIIIPIDGAVIETLASALLIEIRITQGAQALVLPFPLYVQMRGSILDDAGIAPESRGTIPELLETAIAALEEAKNYDNLENKPQINGHTLSGDKTSDDLGLQKKLTAGTNITIANDGTISASGGVTSYNDLTDKPIIKSKRGLEYPIEGKIILPNFSIASYDQTNKTITYELFLSGSDLSDFSLSFTKFTSQLQKEVFKDYGAYTNPPADFYTNYTSAPAKNGMWQIFTQLEGAPTTLSHRLINFYNESQRIQFVITNPQSGHLGEERLFMRVQYMGNLGVWQELTGGGSQIVSGVVNANGTITFTDSDGNTFMTTGSKLVTSGSEQISMGYDSGGFYFSFDDGQEAS